MLARDALHWRWLALAVLGVLAVPLYARILAVAGRLAHQADLFTLPELVALAVAVGAAALVLLSRPARTSRQRRIELALLLGCGVAFRAVFFGATPAISHDAYRYIWDAHLLVNGVSPWAHALSDPALKSLRDTAIWPQVNWRDSASIYPPGAQLFFLLVNTVAPLNIAAMKWAMTLCDFAIGALTLVLLRQRGQDPRRVIIYWWNPLPIVEFTFNAHVDAVATLWTLAALAVLARDTRHARLVSGILLGLAAATKLYPLLFAAALLRPNSSTTTPLASPARTVAASGGRLPAALTPTLRLLLTDPLLLASGATIALIYLPFAFIGLGSGGFLATYFGQRFVDQGILFRLITTIFVFAPLQLVLQGLALVTLCGLIAWLRVRRKLEPAAGVLAVSAIWIALSPHLFPWYVAGLLPLLALYVQPIPFLSPSPRGRGAGVRSLFPLASRERGRREAPRAGGEVYALYLFVLAMPFTYVIFAPGHDPNLFTWFFYVPLALAAMPWILRSIATLFGQTAQAGASATVGASGGRPPAPPYTKSGRVPGIHTGLQPASRSCAGLSRPRFLVSPASRATRRTHPQPPQEQTP